MLVGVAACVLRQGLIKPGLVSKLSMSIKMILASAPPERGNYSCALLCPVYAVMGKEPRSSSMLVSQHSTNRAMPPASVSCLFRARKLEEKMGVAQDCHVPSLGVLGRKEGRVLGYIQVLLRNPTNPQTKNTK